MHRLNRASILLVLSLFITPAISQASEGLPEGPGVNLVYAKCQQCHPITYVIESAGLPDFLWQDTLSLMKQLGMHVSEQEEQQLYTYLTTYLGTKPPPKAPADDTQSSAQVNGTSVYAGSCRVCHGPDGKGASAAFPPLVGHTARLAAADRSYLPLVLVYGLTGEIEVDGKTYHGVMPAWGHLSNEDIAAVLNLITGWNTNDATTRAPHPFTASEIEEARGLGLTGPQVHERRP